MSDDLDLVPNRAHPPRAIPRARNFEGVDLHLVAVDGDCALPGTPLGKTRVIGEEDSLGRASLLAGFLDGDSSGPEEQVACDAVLIGLDDVSDGAHRVDHLDTNWPDGGGPVGRHRTGGEDRMLHSVAHDAECGVDHAPHWVMTHCRTEVELPVALMSVEPIPVVVVDIACGGVGDGMAEGGSGSRRMGLAMFLQVVRVW